MKEPPEGLYSESLHGGCTASGAVVTDAGGRKRDEARLAHSRFLGGLHGPKLCASAAHRPALVGVGVEPADAVERYTERLGNAHGGFEARAVPVGRVFDIAHGGGRNDCLFRELPLGHSLVLTQLPNGQLVDFGDEAFCGDVNQLLIVVVQHNLCHL